MRNYKLSAIQLGEKLKRLRSVNEIERVARALFPFACRDHPNDAITSTRAKTVYDWVMTLSEQPLSEAEKEELLAQFEQAMHSFPFEDLPQEEVPEEHDVWSLIHPEVRKVAEARFRDRYFADAAEAAFKEVNNRVKAVVKVKAGRELDGADLMHQAFSPNKPLILLADLSTETGRNIQQGYMEIFAGAMMGVRNPKAHENITISRERGLHFLVLASLLMCRLEEALSRPLDELRAIYDQHHSESGKKFSAAMQCQCDACKEYRARAS